MHVNSPENIKTFDSTIRESALAQILTNIGAEQDFCLVAELYITNFNLPKMDHPWKRNPELKFGPEQTLDNGLELAFGIAFVGAERSPQYIIRLDSRHLINLPFEDQKGQFIFHLSRENNRATVDFIGQYSDSVLPGSAQPILDQTQINRLVQLLDCSLGGLLNMQNERYTRSLLSTLILPMFEKNIIKKPGLDLRKLLEKENFKNFPEKKRPI